MVRSLQTKTVSGHVAQALLRSALLAAVLGQVVYLAGRPEVRVRADLTTEKLYTLSDSTRTVLRNLGSPVFVEAYFSSSSLLPAVLAEYRTGLENLLDEYVQISGGRIVIQYFDPHDDVEVEKKAERLGIRPQSVRDADERSYSLREIYQGFRLMYGADKQKVIPFLGFTNELWQYESVFTPVIKELAVLNKPKIGVIASQTEANSGFNPFGGMQRSQPRGFERFREVGKDRYEFVNVDLNEGKLVPGDLAGLLLIRPKRMTDRQKYAVDQYLMQGGRLAVFADTTEYMPGEDRSFQGNEVSYDDPASKLKLVDMLAHYGVRVEPEKVLADVLPDAFVTFAVPAQTFLGTQLVPLTYPYWFRALDIHWGEGQYVNAFVRETLQSPGISNGSNRTELAQRFSELFKPGLHKENDLLKGFRQGPGLFWPCPVALADPMPAGLSGEIWMRTSPRGIAKPAPPALDPFEGARTGQERQRAYERFEQRVAQDVGMNERRQFGLLAHVEGEFKSFFDGKEIPPAKPPVAEEEKPKDPLAEEIKESPLEQKTGEKKDEPQPETAGPPVPEPDKPAEKKDDEPAPILQGKAAHLIVIGDADFIRDDVIGAEYAQAGGPADPGPAYQFVQALCDWIGEDRDLMALRSRSPIDRKLNFGGMEIGIEQDTVKLKQDIKRKETASQVLNILVPPVLLLIVWVLVMTRRMHQKQVFLTKTGA